MGRRVRTNPLAGRTVFFPTMSDSTAALFAAAFRSQGIEARPFPPSDAETLRLGNRFSSGEECLPLKVTLGDALKVLESGIVKPSEMAFFMPTATGPCRFGLYASLTKKVFGELGYGEVAFISPTCDDGYAGVGENANAVLRVSWMGIVAGDLMVRLLLRIRPYELEPGSADAAFSAAMADLVAAFEVEEAPGPKKRRVISALRVARARLRSVPVDSAVPRPLIGIVGEIFCRLNSFSNDSAIREVEAAGGECWLSDISEWVHYTDSERIRLLRRHGRRLSKDMASAILKIAFQRRDEKALHAVFGGDFAGREEPHDVREIAELARPYMAPEGTLGETLLSVGKTVWLRSKGADGVLDINPFSCMNGVVSEAVYPRVSRDLGGLPVRVLYYDGKHADQRDAIEVFVDLARDFRDRKDDAAR